MDITQNFKTSKELLSTIGMDIKEIKERPEDLDVD
jgi:hypothetical protein